ncbi:hypothetical protein [Phyllobacterium zundukense]|nr:hypothetical protein [Phyllobacterium zundukense]
MRSLVVKDQQLDAGKFVDQAWKAATIAFLTSPEKLSARWPTIQSGSF